MQTEQKTLDEYCALPYQFTVTADEAEDGPYWFAQVVELPGCGGDGATPEAAVSHARQAMKEWLRVALAHGDPIPEPASATPFSGKFNLRVPRALHRALSVRAQQEGVSLNTWITTVVSRYGT